MELHFVIWLHPSFYNEITFINYNSFKIVFDLKLIKAIDLHNVVEQKYLL